MVRKYEHNFTLSEDPPSRDTSAKARRAYTEALDSAGFHPYAADGNGVIRKLPHSARVGEFDDAIAARKAIEDAEKAAEAADKGKFFVEASTLTRYSPLRTRGDRYTPPPPPPPLRPAPATRAAQHLATIRRLSIKKN